MDIPILKKSNKTARAEVPSPKPEVKSEPVIDKKQLTKAEKTFRAGMLNLLDLIAPAAFKVTPNYLQLENFYLRTLFVFTYPRYLQVNWLSPLINYDITADISMFIYPLKTQNVMGDLRKKVSQLESTKTMEEEKGFVRNPELETAISDIEGLRDVLQRGEIKLFQYALYFTIYAKSLEELNTLTKQLESTLGGMLVYTKQAMLQMEQGFNSCLPLCQDELDIKRNLDTGSLSTTFPFVSAELTSNEGILYGLNRHNNSLILFDRFKLENANSVVFAKAGAGKSISGNTPVLIKNNQGIQLTEIGPLVEKLIHQGNKIKFADDLEGIFDPEIEVYTFNKTLKGEWAKVTVAAKKKAPKILYQFTTKSGREIITTADHNIVVLKDGQVRASKSEQVKLGEAIPLARFLPEITNPLTKLNLLETLEKQPNLYLSGSQLIIKKFYQALKQAGLDARLDCYLYQYGKGRKIPLDYFRKIIRFLKIDLAENDLKNLVIVSRNKKEKYSLPVVFPLEPAFLRLLGYITSEGTIRKNRIIISNTEEAVTNNIKQSLASLGLNYFSTGREVIIDNKTLAELIRAIGAAGKAQEKRIPIILFSLRNELIAHYLMAYFEGDGGVEKTALTATSKSPLLISDLAWLLLRFKIIGRISKKLKYATNVSKKVKRYYWQLTISGKEQLQRFQQSIGFISPKKNQRLQVHLSTIGKTNTNVDLVPNLESIFQEIYRLLYRGAKQRAPAYLIELKNKIKSPSRTTILNLLTEFDQRLREILAIEEEIKELTKLPQLATITELGANNLLLNKKLWQELGESWRLMKNGLVSPGCGTALRATRIVSNYSWKIDFPQIAAKIQTIFAVLGISLQQYDQSLWDYLHYSSSDRGSYQRLSKAISYLQKEYISYRQEIDNLREKFVLLYLQATSDLFWDPIVSIKKIKNKDQYVYDLTVDNEVFLAGFGGLFIHNSYAIKLEALRSLMFGTDIIVIDPENEYKQLCEAVGGSYLPLSLNAKQRINPFDLPKKISEDESGEEILRNAVIMIKGLIGLMVGTLTPEEDAILDRAIYETYALKDITSDPESHANPPPVMSDLQNVLNNMTGAESLARRLGKYVEGTFAGLFNKPTNFDLEKGFVVFSIRDLEEQLRPIGMYLVLNYIWNKVRFEMRKRILIIDEAWVMMQHEDSAKFLYALAKRCRKYFLGLTVITQDVEDFLGSPYGRAVISNSSMQLLLKQSTSSIDKIAEIFNLTEGEKYLLLESDVGEGLFFAGLNHVAIKVIASYTEDQIITTDPQQLLELKKAEESQELVGQ